MIPDFQKIMLPLLKHVQDGREYRINDIVDAMAIEFKITETEKKELLPSGQTFIFGSRVGWARTYLKKAGLLDNPKRGITQITQQGLDVLKSNRKEINIAYLRRFDSFIDFQNNKNNGENEIEHHENIESAVLEITKNSRRIDGRILSKYKKRISTRDFRQDIKIVPGLF